ncbi:MAG TPA: cyclic nucleotide-binding protein [Rhodospirillaceae bacterium]|nr:cyclic nucleotide-binding protein [Rhodospirillaceae bacterium]
MRKVLVILGQLRDTDAEWMARVGSKRTVPDGEILITEGEHNASLFILLDGRLRIEDAKIGTIANLGVGEIVGEMSYVDDAPPSASVVAEGDSTVLELTHDSLDQRMESDPGFGMRFYRALSFFLADRLRGTVRRLGYGQAGGLDTEDVLEDELDDRLLDSVSLAGDRFDRMLKILAGGRAG